MNADTSTARNDARILVAAGFALAISSAIILVAALVQGQWLTDALGRPIANDFVNVWAAGRFVLEGQAATAYDWAAHKAMEVRAIGHDFANYYGWHYPPTFLFVAAALAALPYMPAALLWLAVTLAAYVVTLRAILGTRLGIALGLGFPAALWNVTAGQNGFLTTALIGGTLVNRQKRPVLAGIYLGLLTYKPQFGLLFPLVLAVGGHWHVLLVASGVTIVAVLASLLVLGTAPWLAFINGLGQTSDAVLGQGLADLDRMQSLFGALRALGVGQNGAMIAQVCLALALAVALSLLWRSRASDDLKSAALATGALLATPYLYMYDLAILAVPVAFLIRDRLGRLSVSDYAGLTAVAALILSFPYAKTQVGFAASLIVALLIGSALRRR
jgi:hypothetical protein